MKRKIAFGALFSALALPMAAHATDGTITFNGAIEAQTCTISVNGGDKDATVQLPTVSASTLAAKGQTAGATNFTIALSECSGKATQVRAFFEAGPNVDGTSGNLNNTNGAATNVQVQLLNADGVALKAGDESQRSYAATTLSNGAATMIYGAQYYATGASTAGDVRTSVTYAIDYL
ncbi:fimbrial protein [Burkholderia ubonensis]|uniref:Fimbrial protein n=1 Tax=Burkholderia ubonensis TaxID=101571 RepID=A0A102IHJ9_9BURK|nr:fimbrial protein [Burkholderia ubonensis]AOI68794.1 fimbrial protein [Burkholderia ubonensis]KUZ18009.1 fimbrial protein [Burkholderia ubonensis]KUZ32322.1 fimbrial protein [Burkholderia ubonensis]KUZ38797.1 fimbrial protein [Burkholderia ubonensis]KUZ47972.1 fimbrial protein [Burkholderia ubonensis]